MAGPAAFRFVLRWTENADGWPGERMWGTMSAFTNWRRTDAPPGAALISLHPLTFMPTPIFRGALLAACLAVSLPAAAFAQARAAGDAWTVHDVAEAGVRLRLPPGAADVHEYEAVRSESSRFYLADAAEDLFLEMEVFVPARLASGGESARMALLEEKALASQDLRGLGSDRIPSESTEHHLVLTFYGDPRTPSAARCCGRTWPARDRRGWCSCA